MKRSTILGTSEPDLRRLLVPTPCPSCRKWADEQTRLINATRTDPVRNKLGLPYP